MRSLNKLFDNPLAGLAEATALIDPQFDVSSIEWRDCARHLVGALPPECAFVYIFHHPGSGRVLKVGKAGSKSRARLYQHYNGNAASCLAKSLCAYPEGAGLSEPPDDPGTWIKNKTELTLAILPGDRVEPALLRFRTHFLEAWLILKFKPVYEKG